MAHMLELLLFLLCSNVLVSFGTEAKFRNLTQFVLDSFNEKQYYGFVYNSAEIVNAYKKNSSLPIYFLQLDFTVGCNSSSDCTASHLVCELILKEDPTTNATDILYDRTKCSKKETEPKFPTNGHGFGEENISDEVRRIAAFAIQQSDTRRSVVDIMSVKRQMIGNATTLYLTLKVTRNEGGDASLFEVCEAEVNQTGEMALESNLTCFLLNGMLTDLPVSADDVTAIAERAADELDSLSFSEFTLKLVDVLKAETTVTPGSEGTVTTLELRLAPTLCLKNVDVESDTDGLYEKRQCPENIRAGRLKCSVTSWDRPWLDDTLYSEPNCSRDLENAGNVQSENKSSAVREPQEDNSNTMMNDQMEVVNEDTSVPAIEHHSISVVEELDPIEEEIVANNENLQIPVVEEPFVAKHTYCTGCLLSLM